MDDVIDILKQPGVEQIEKHKNLVIDKKSASYPVYRIPLKYLYYNDKNDRISTELIRYRSENHTELPADRDEFNLILEKMIYDSNPDKLKRTRKSISERGQDNPGVTLMDGRVVDGNRRFTCLRMIERETNIEQFFETVVLGLNYDDNYKHVKSLELELQMGVEGPVEYDPIDRLFGLYNSIRIEKKFTPEEYAKLFDNVSVSDVRKDLRLAELMCKYLEFIKSPGKYYLAKDMKLDGALHEIPAILEKVRKKHPELVDETESFIFTLITMDVDTRINLYIRNLRSIVDSGDYPMLLETVRESVQRTQDEIDSKDIEGSNDIAEIRKNTEISEKITDAVSQYMKAAKNNMMNDAPVRHLKEAAGSLKSIVMVTVSDMDDPMLEEARALVKEIEGNLKELRSRLDL